jgi:hypothetical protein
VIEYVESLDEVQEVLDVRIMTVLNYACVMLCAIKIHAFVALMLV